MTTRRLPAAAGDTRAASTACSAGPDGPSVARIDTCVHCGFCLPTCPTYLLWGEEMDSPRGRIYLMKAGVEGRAELTPSFVTHFDNCLGCLACVTACPSGVQYGPLIERTRAQIEQQYSAAGRRPLFRALLMALVPYPCAHALALAPLALLGGLLRGARRARCRGGPRQRAAGARARRDAGAGAAGHAGGPVRRACRPRRRRWARSASKVALLTGCVQRLSFGHVNDATVRVLAAEGCRVTAPERPGLLRRAAAARRPHRPGARSWRGTTSRCSSGRASTASW